jgi:transcriptional regulator with XRE-family HTH domain
MSRNPLSAVGLRCRREALGLTRADLADILDVNEGVIRSWEIGKSEPRDPLSIHMTLGALEDAALECLDELLAPADDRDETVRSLPTALIAYSVQADYQQHTRWAQRLPISAYRACVGRAFQLLSEDNIPVEIVSPYD